MALLLSAAGGEGPGDTFACQTHAHARAAEEWWGKARGRRVISLMTKRDSLLISADGVVGRRIGYSGGSCGEKLVTYDEKTCFAMLHTVL